MKSISKNIILLIFGVSLILLPISCGDGGDDDDGSPENPQENPQEQSSVPPEEEPPNGTDEDQTSSIDGSYELEAVFEYSSCRQDFANELEQVLEEETVIINVKQDTQDKSRATVTLVDCTEDCTEEAEVNGNTLILKAYYEEVMNGCTLKMDETDSITIDGDFISGDGELDINFEGSCYPYEDCRAYFEINGKRVEQSKIEMKRIKLMRDNLLLKMTCVDCEEPQKTNSFQLFQKFRARLR